jgi:hypothetical protein
MNHVMLDLETLGTRPGCSVISIGAVAFDPGAGTLGGGFYTVVNQKSCERAGLVTDKGTVGWWMRQSPEAQKVLVESRSGGMELAAALDAFTEFLSDFPKDVRIWGCGAAFDNVILANCYTAAGKRLPWKYVNDRCYRTLKAIIPAIEMERTGTYHNAYDDAVSQAKHALKIMARMTEALK